MLGDADFSGRVVSIWSKDPAQGGVLENVRVQRLDKRAFLVGELVDDGIGSDPRIGATFWFAVDEVLMLTVFEDVHAARVAFAARKSREDEQGSQKQKWRFW